jgi:hypothetical protein
MYCSQFKIKATANAVSCEGLNTGSSCHVLIEQKGKGCSFQPLLKDSDLIYEAEALQT